jgi:hypothetical protein
MRALIVLLFLLSMIQNVRAEVEFEFGGDAYVRWFSRDLHDVQSKYRSHAPFNTTVVNPPRSPRKSQGFAQMARLKFDMVHDEGVALRTRTVLMGDKWGGDVIAPASNTLTINGTNYFPRPIHTPAAGNNGVTGNSDDSRGGYAVRMDYGFLEYKKLGWLFRAGRQESNWAECLTNCDDRRDRLLVLRPMWDGFVIAVYDKRRPLLNTSDSDDGDMYGLLYLRYAGPLEYGVLFARWENPNKSYFLTGVNNISPYVKYQGEQFNAQVLVNWLGQGSSKSYFPDHHYAYALRAGYQVNDQWRFDAQTLQIVNAGYISVGYDTYLSMVNGNPEHNQTNQMAMRLGGFGTATGGRDARESLYSLRTSYDVMPKLRLGLAGGFFQKYNHFNTVLAQKKEDNVAIDLTARYQLASNAVLKGNLGRVMGDNHLTAMALNFEASFE